ncbi:GNAT family N-acetyltransferase [Streptomyces tauricus]|uniref:GNAT family N-acetyltransferase n=1 Tax=Streptomyces tauricus TaxID=68274 RepID=UPI003401DF09
MERTFTAERAARARAIAETAGRRISRSVALPTDRVGYARLLKQQGSSLGEVADATGVPKTSLHRYLAEVSPAAPAEGIVMTVSNLFSTLAPGCEAGSTFGTASWEECPQVSDRIPGLPRGYRARQATDDDLGDIHRLVTACERVLYGQVHTDHGRIAADLARPGLVPELDTRLIHDRSGELAARAWVNRRSEVDVHPEHRGRGLGGALLDWAEARARQTGSTRIVQTVPDDDQNAVALLRSRGYEPMVTQWLLEFLMPQEPTVPEPPAGITVRPFDPGNAQHAYQVVEDAFDEWQQRRKTYQEWALNTVERPAFAPAMSPLAFANGQLVGVAISLDVPDAGEGYIEQVAVRRDHRNRGIARLLLRTVFRSFHQQGRQACTLETHSETGALNLYLSVGMGVRHSSTVFQKDLLAEQ